MSAGRLLLVGAIASLLAACGFHPLYASSGDHGATRTALASIYVEPIPDRLGYELRNSLIDLLDGPGRAAGASYRLQVSLTRQNQGIALQNDATITRYNDTLTVNYALSDAENDKLITKGVETGLSAYNVVQSPYATLVAQQDADKRAADDIAERIRIDLALFFSRGAPSPQATIPK